MKQESWIPRTSWGSYEGQTQNHFEESYVGRLWYIVLEDDKRSFNEWFSEEFGIYLCDDIAEDQLNYIVVNVMIPSLEDQKGKLQKIKTLNKKMGRFSFLPYC
jgi:hypothetical protein